MKKLLFFFILILTTTANADSCLQLYENLSPQLKQDISQLTWVDVNPIRQNAQCHFVVRYYPCDSVTHKQMNILLPDAIGESTPRCHFVSKGINHHTEGYCTVENIQAAC